MSKFKTSLAFLVSLFSSTSAFSSVCLKNDMDGANGTIAVFVTTNLKATARECSGWFSLCSRAISISDIYVSKEYAPKLRVISGTGQENTIDNFGNDLQDGDMVHIKGSPDFISVSWVEKGNCNGRAPT